MLKKKNLMALFSIFVLGIALLTGCGTNESKEVGQKETVDLSGNENQTEQKGNAESGSNQLGEDSNPSTAIVSGTIKAIDSATGTLTIATESNGDLELKVINANEIVDGKSIASLVELANKTNTKVTVEYEVETNVLTAIDLKN